MICLTFQIRKKNRALGPAETSYCIHAHSTAVFEATRKGVSGLCLPPCTALAVVARAVAKSLEGPVIQPVFRSA
jgi:hypothetical protein